MSVLNGNISIKIKEVQLMSWGVSSVSVVARPYHALAFRLRGRASFSDSNLNLDTKQGDVFYMPAHQAYSAVYQEENEILVIHFESDSDSEMENYELNNYHTVSALFRKINDIWSKKANGYYYEALSVFCEILRSIEIQQNYSIDNETMKAFEKAVECMEEGYISSAFSVNKMVEEAHMSGTYFRKLFLKRFNTTPTEYLKEKRLLHAERLLSTGRCSVKEAAELSGFNDVKYFCRVVKKEYGVPPSKLFKHTGSREKSY